MFGGYEAPNLPCRASSHLPDFSQFKLATTSLLVVIHSVIAGLQANGIKRTTGQRPTIRDVIADQQANGIKRTTGYRATRCSKSRAKSTSPFATSM